MRHRLWLWHSNIASISIATLNKELAMSVISLRLSAEIEHRLARLAEDRGCSRAQIAEAALLAFLTDTTAAASSTPSSSHHPRHPALTRQAA